MPAFHLILGRLPRHPCSLLALTPITLLQPFSRLICIMHFAYTPKLGQVCPIRIGAFQTGVVRRRCGPFTTFVAPLFVNFQFYLLTFLTTPHSTCCSTADKPRSDITSAFNTYKIITFSFRTTKYLKKASLTRTCAIGGFFLSIPLFLIGKC